VDAVRTHWLSVTAVICCATILAGCWKEHDVITIKGDGQTTFTSDVVVSDKSFTVADIDSVSSEFIKELQDAGWRVQRHWVSKTLPYKLTFSGDGNIRQVKSASDFYQIKKLNDKTYSIRFIPAESERGKSSRSIEFKHGFFGGGPRILDQRGSEVQQIANVSADQTYRIAF
jgi:hypothetical protein